MRFVGCVTVTRFVGCFTMTTCGFGCLTTTLAGIATVPLFGCI